MWPAQQLRHENKQAKLCHSDYTVSVNCKQKSDMILCNPSFPISVLQTIVFTQLMINFIINDQYMFAKWIFQFTISWCIYSSLGAIIAHSPLLSVCIQRLHFHSCQK